MCVCEHTYTHKWLLIIKMSRKFFKTHSKKPKIREKIHVKSISESLSLSLSLLHPLSSLSLCVVESRVAVIVCYNPMGVVKGV